MHSKKGRVDFVQVHCVSTVEYRGFFHFQYFISHSFGRCSGNCISLFCIMRMNTTVREVTDSSVCTSHGTYEGLCNQNDFGL